MRWTTWLGLLLAYFIVPAGLALLIGRRLPLATAEMAGFFRVGTAPGAPLMTRNIAKMGFDMQLAAGYQVRGGLLTPVMLPLEVGLAAVCPPAAEQTASPRSAGVPPARVLRRSPG